MLYCGAARSRLPLEIWIEVLQFATAVPDSTLRPKLAYRVPRMPETDDERPSAIVSRYRKAMATKHALVQVCREWNAVATSFLYHHIYIKTVQDIVALLAVLPSSPTICGINDTRTLGCQVKRLDLLVTGLEWSSAETPYEESLPVLLCKACPNLVALIYEYEESFTSLPIREFCPRLEYIFSSHTFTLEHSKWVIFLASLPSVVSLEIPPIANDSEQLPQDTRDKAVLIAKDNAENTYPHIQELLCTNVYSFNKWIAQLSIEALPNLRAISFLSDLWPSDLWPSELSLFVARHGSTLTYIHFELPSSEPRETFSGLLEILELHCPQLQELSLISPFHDDGGEPASKSKTLGTVKTLRLLRNDGKMGYDGEMPWQQFFEDALHFATYFSRLRRIRLGDEGDLRKLREGTDVGHYHSFLTTCHERGLEVIDSLDELLV